MTKTAFTEVKEQVIKPETLLLTTPSQSDQERELVEKINEKHKLLKKFGIQSKTSEILESKISEIAKKEEEERKTVATNQVLKVISDTLFPFNMIETKTIHEIAKKHDLHIAPLSWYKKDIPDECLADLNVLVTNHLQILASKSKSNFFIAVLDSAYQGKIGTFEFDKYNVSLVSADLSKLFYIVAPSKDLTTDKHTVQIGRELLTVKKPSIDFSSLGFHSDKVQFPKFATDPIIFLPMRVGKSYVSIAATGWDKEWEDPLLQQIM